MMPKGKRFFRRMFSGDGFFLHDPKRGVSEVYAVRQLADGHWSLMGGNEMTAADDGQREFPKGLGSFYLDSVNRIGENFVRLRLYIPLGVDLGLMVAAKKK